VVRPPLFGLGVVSATPYDRYEKNLKGQNKNKNGQIEVWHPWGGSATSIPIVGDTLVWLGGSFIYHHFGILPFWVGVLCVLNALDMVIFVLIVVI
jgi:hypothetical protein